MPIDVLIEGYLFYKSAPQKKRTLMKMFEISKEDFDSSLNILKERLKSGATRIIETDEDIQLAACPEMAPVIESIRKNELKNDIGKAGAETLAIILYRGPVTRFEIDRVRGVNSSFILRNLMVRGLIERSYDKAGNNYKFTVTPALLANLGVTNKSELPDFARVNDMLDNFAVETNLSQGN